MEEKKDTEVSEVSRKLTKHQEMIETWDKIDPQRFPNGTYLVQSKYRTKMSIFLLQVEFTWEDLQEFEKTSLRKSDDESWEDYRKRRKFTEHLIKYRREVIAMINYKMMLKQQELLKQEQLKLKETRNGTENTGIPN